VTLRATPWLLAVFFAASALFAMRPDLDLAASRALLDPAGHFVLDGNRWIYLLNDTVTWLSRVAALVLLVATVLALLPLPARDAGTAAQGGAQSGAQSGAQGGTGGGAQPAKSWRAWCRARRAPIVFLLLSLALGPGLLVNTLLKEHSGRARPVTTVTFGGTKQFSGAWVIGDQCARNCAFVSGHAAVAAWPVAGAFLARRRRTRRAWLAGGLLAGLAVGLGRMATGSHFLSDVVLAVLMVYLVTAACAAWLLRRPDPHRA
jgi:membrane-associated PAP2 superfamily phosphatase